MTIDINLLRVEKGGDPEKVKTSEWRRYRDPALVDKVVRLDQDWRKAQFNMEQKKKELSQGVQKQITERKKTSKGQDKCEDLIPQKEAMEKEIQEMLDLSEQLQKERDTSLAKIGNILHDSVAPWDAENNKPGRSQDEEKDNAVISLWGTPKKFDTAYMTEGFRPHYQLVEMIGGCNFDAGRDVAGHRGYFLMGPLVQLNQALLNYGLAFLAKESYTPIQPPFFMRADIMGQAAELKDYEETLYKIVESADEPQNDKFLIATSEQPITAFYRDQTIGKEKLPIRFAGISSCFRKEAGSSGRDIRGIFRVHQFEKVEQFCIVDENDSWEEHQKMTDIGERFYQSLGLAYRVVNICTGEINDAASKKHDLEAWFPGDNDGKGQYRELVSCSNCLDFQSRRMNTRAGFGDDQQTPHMLNSTLCATGRGMCCILENYQTKDGIVVPPVLVPYMLGQEFIPFKFPPPEEEGANKKKKEGGDKKKDNKKK